MGDRARDRRRPARPRRRAPVLRRVPRAAVRRHGPPELRRRRADRCSWSGSWVLYNLFGHVQARVDNWLDPWRDPQGAGFQVVQALYAFGRGGLLGVGLGAGLPTIGGRPADPGRAHGLPARGARRGAGARSGLLAILGLYLVRRDARACGSPRRRTTTSASLLAAGLALVIGVQAFIIAAGNLKLIPLTGITLPFISYGGSSLLANAVVVGLLLALSDRGAEPPPAPRERRGRCAACARPAGDRQRRVMSRRPGHDAESGPSAATAPVARHRRQRLPDGARRRLRVRDPRRRRRLVAGGRGAAALDRARQPGRHRASRAGRCAGPIVDRNGQWLARSGRDATARRPASTATTTISPVVGLRVAASTARPGLERTYNAELLGLAGVGPVRRPARQVRRAAGEPARPPALAGPAAPAGRRQGPRLGPGRGGDARPDDRRDPRPRLDPDVRRVGASPTRRRPGATFERLQADDAAAAPAARHARPLRARVGVQDRDRRSRPSTPARSTPAHDVPGAARRPRRRASCVDGLPHPGRPPPADRRHRARPDRARPRSAATSGTRWPGSRTGGDRLVDEAAQLGFGAPIPFDLPTAISRVTGGDGSAPGGFIDDAELASASFGQGETFVTPLQMALVAATVANDGVLMKPHVVTRADRRRDRARGPSRPRSGGGS